MQYVHDDITLLTEYTSSITAYKTDDTFGDTLLIINDINYHIKQNRLSHTVVPLLKDTLAKGRLSSKARFFGSKYYGCL